MRCGISMDEDSTFKIYWQSFIYPVTGTCALGPNWKRYCNEVVRASITWEWREKIYDRKDRKQNNASQEKTLVLCHKNKHARSPKKCLIRTLTRLRYLWRLHANASENLKADASKSKFLFYIYFFASKVYFLHFWVIRLYADAGEKTWRRFIRYTIYLFFASKGG